ncbi:MAG: hypothetical protein JSS81_06590 [Acidobacteria bacterium]|nr:hypothetical protein [Acidobacteriota bacterium]
MLNNNAEPVILGTGSAFQSGRNVRRSPANEKSIEIINEGKNLLRGIRQVGFDKFVLDLVKRFYGLKRLTIGEEKRE